MHPFCFLDLFSSMGYSEAHVRRVGEGESIFAGVGEHWNVSEVLVRSLLRCEVALQ